MPQVKGPRFTEEIDNKIIELMKIYGNIPNYYVKISEEINKQFNSNYTSKKIRQRWISTLDPKFHHKPLNEDEKSFIIQWVENNKTPDDPKIHWKILISEIEKKFGKLRSENMVKNFWNLRNRKSGNKQHKNINYDKNKKDIVSPPLPPLHPLEDNISTNAKLLEILKKDFFFLMFE
ncbi:hypothetical protein C1645_837569 [Glomus cerebriforme]|uniref:HTH myb-type domain-containing protein n=1 Tax=Glomus cerebriforme TaxID=658196 RepID=A0A397SF56_9GLOM|nr:hypothetical protein C1645_837569 [Glomus cerebriforme]